MSELSHLLCKVRVNPSYAKILYRIENTSYSTVAQIHRRKWGRYPKGTMQDTGALNEMHGVCNQRSTARNDG